MKRFTILLGLTSLFLPACTHTPQIMFSELNNKTTASRDNSSDLHATFVSLLQRVRGKQIGDPVFLEKSTARLILHKIDAMRLQMAAEHAEFNEAEYQARLKRIRALHQKYLVFSLVLQLPFYTGWTRSELMDFLKTNLVVTLETSSNNIFYPDRRFFLTTTPERQTAINAVNNDELEMKIPLRIFFNKKISTGDLVSEHTQRLTLKLRLLQQLPFRIGFFDEKYYQGFTWKIKRQ